MRKYELRALKMDRDRSLRCQKRRRIEVVAPKTNSRQRFIASSKGRMLVEMLKWAVEQGRFCSSVRELGDF